LDIREGAELEMVLADIFRKLQYLLKRTVHFKDTLKTADTTTTIKPFIPKQVGVD
jgi:hypothetical protein